MLAGKLQFRKPININAESGSLLQRKFKHSGISKDGFKDEINKVLDHFSVNTLRDTLSILKRIESIQLSGPNHAVLEKIQSGDKYLLEKLAI